MSRHDAGRTFSAALLAAVACFAVSANAQTIGGAPAVTTVHTVPVSTSPPGSRSDDAIILDVRRAIRRVPDMVDSSIRIRAHRGVVTLTGSVPESWQISRAGNAARSVRGVRGVSNRLTVRDKHVAAIGRAVSRAAG